MKLRIPAANSLAGPCRLLSSQSRTLRPSIVSRLSHDHFGPCAKGASRSYASISAANLQFGQPVHETHPHILKPGELTPGITAQEYFDRRAHLAQKLPKDGIAVLRAADLKWRSGAVFYPFRQESNFLYLTGFNEPEAMAVIQKTGDELGDYIFHLFARPKDPAAEQWSGPWSGLQAAEDVFNADRTGDINKLDINKLDRHLGPILAGAARIYTDIEVHTKDGQLTAFADAVFQATDHKVGIDRLQPLVNQLRVVKSPAEAANMRHAGRVSGRAITAAMRRPWARERDLQAFLEHGFAAEGCGGPAYVPVVAGGSRANMIHYVLNDARLGADDGDAAQMVLVDAGGEYGTYVADITRTWPVATGRFTPAQRDLYEAVLRVQRAGVALCRADGGLTLDGVHRATEQALRRELRDLGFDVGANGSGRLEALFPHHVGHYVGLDVHDCPGYGRNVPLRRGHCVTVEPGVYVPADDDRWPVHFRGMGIRIEDSVYVDDEGPVVLTAEAVKEVVDIEALRD
ncbi:hypothetical protein diail_1698 [Diaporthe ilicicola]|nr:hypothetical protein diail_1698 [Diaporthe ilicicola]